MTGGQVSDDYPDLGGELVGSWGPAYEGPFERPNEFSADGALRIIGPLDSKGDTVASLQIVLARRELVRGYADQDQAAVAGIELTRRDIEMLIERLQHLRQDIELEDWREGHVDALGQPIPPLATPSD